MLKSIIYVTLLALIITSCGTRIGEQKSLGLNVTKTITANVETSPTPQGRQDDSADDPAIWVNKNNPSKSVIFGSDKKGGIIANDLNGAELKYYKLGRINNIDIRQNVNINGAIIDVLAGTERDSEDITIGTINNNGEFKHEPITGTEALNGKEVYGFALGYANNNLQAFVNDKEGNIYIFNLSRSNSTWNATLLKILKVATQPEGMVVDDQQNILYVGEEIHGIWKFDLSTYNTPTLLDKSTEQTNEFIMYDIEGISLYPTNETDGYLIVSSQGNNSYAVYERQGNNKYLTSFRIVDGVVDGVEETDGLDVVNVKLNEDFPKGILVTQDGFNFDGKKKKSQNFKIIDWRKVESLLK